MKCKNLMIVAAMGVLAISCGKSNNASENDSVAVNDSVPAVVSDTVAADTTPAADSVTTPAPAEEQVAPKEEPKEVDNGLDKEVDKIIAMINQHTDAVKSLKKEGIPPSSSIAFNMLTKLPDYDSKLKKIKKKLTPEQKARIDVAEKKFKKVADSWQ